MKTSMLSLLAAAVLFSGVAVASAAEPVALSDSQLDQVSAGTFGFTLTIGSSAQAGGFGLYTSSAAPTSQAILGASGSQSFSGISFSTCGCGV